MDGKGDLILVEIGNHAVRRVTQAGAVTTIAGNGVAGYKDGPAAQARFHAPWGIAVAKSGAIYVSEQSNHRIRRISPVGQVVTIAGTGKAGFANGVGTAAALSQPWGLAIDPAGNLFVADYGNSWIRKITPAGAVTTFAGGASGLTNGPLAKASFSGLSALLFDPLGRLLVADRGNHVIRRITPPQRSCDDGNACTKDTCGAADGTCTHAPDVNAKPGGTCTTQGGCAIGQPTCAGGKLACSAPVADPAMVGKPCDDGDVCTVTDTCAGGKCTAPETWHMDTLVGGTHGFHDGGPKEARMQSPVGLAADPTGFIYVADWGNRAVRRVSPEGFVTTLAGTGGIWDQVGPPGKGGFVRPWGIAWHPGGFLLVSDMASHRVRKLTTDGVISAWAGNGQPDHADGPALKARLNGPSGMAIDAKGATWLADRHNQRIRKIAADGSTVSTIAGSGAQGAKDGPALSATFKQPVDVAIDAKGAIYVADWSNHRIRRIAAGQVITVAGGAIGYADGKGAAARFSHPNGLAWAPDGTLTLADTSNSKLRSIKEDGSVTTLAGGPTGFVDGPLSKARFDGPIGILWRNGTLWTAEWGNHALRRMRVLTANCDDANGCTADSCVPAKGCAHKTVAGGTPCEDGSVCTMGDSCVGGASCKAGVASNCDDGNPCTKDDCHPTKGCGNVVLANGTGCAANAKCDVGICVASSCTGKADGFACDEGSACSLSSHCAGGQCTTAANGWIDTVAGGGPPGYRDGHGPNALFGSTDDIEVCPDGRIFVADGGRRIRQIHADGTVSTFAGSGLEASTDGKGLAASFIYPSGLTCDAAGHLYVVTGYRIRRVTKEGVSTVLAGEGAYGHVDGKGKAARFASVIDAALAPDGALIVAQTGIPAIRRVTLDGVVTTIAGGGPKGSANGLGIAASFGGPEGVAVAADGTIYFSDWDSHAIRRISPGGYVSLFAGSGVAGSADGLGTAASFGGPQRLAMGPDGAIYVAGIGNGRLARVTAAGQVTTVAMGAGSTDGAVGKASVGSVRGLDFAADGTLWMTTGTERRIRRLVPAVNPCDDANACTKDSCDAKTGCAHTKLVDGAACGVSGTCKAGLCKPAIARITAGAGHACALTGQGTVWCWGKNNDGQLGDGSQVDRHEPVQVKGLPTVKSVGTSWDHSCALAGDGRLWCWGSTVYGQLGSFGSKSTKPVQLAAPLDVVAYDGGGHFGCALDAKGAVWCWGLGGHGELGDGADSKSAKPLQVQGVPAMSSLGVGVGHVCALAKSGGGAWCWGRNSSGELGGGSKSAMAKPLQVKGLSDLISIAAGGATTCVAKKDGSAWCWGDGGKGQLGDGGTSNSLVPVAVKGLGGALEVGVGGAFACARRNDGSAWCWGHNAMGTLGQDSILGTNLAKPVAGATSVVALGIGPDHGRFVDDQGKVWSWGRNRTGVLGIGAGEVSWTPTPVAMTGAPKAISAGRTHSCAILADDKVSCWGVNHMSSLGNGTSDYAIWSAPGPLSKMPSAKAVAAGYSQTCAIDATGAVWCWGGHDFVAGQFAGPGHGKPEQSDKPVKLQGVAGATQLATGKNHTCALAQGGKVHCWGHNEFGQLGDGSKKTAQAPVATKPIHGVTPVINIAAGDGFTCARVGAGVVKCWGQGGLGQLGDGNKTDSLAPVTVASLPNLALSPGTLAAGRRHACTLTVVGDVLCWGANDSGQLGDGTTTLRAKPVAVIGVGGALAIGAGDTHTCALVKGGAVWCWGDGGIGQLGDGKTNFSTKPVQAQGLTASALSVGRHHACAIANDKRAWCWGAGDYGQLGNGLGWSRKPLRTSVF